MADLSEQEEKRIEKMIDALVKRAKKRESYETCKNGSRRNWKRNI